MLIGGGGTQCNERRIYGAASFGRRHIEAAQSGHGEYYVEVVREDSGEVTIIITLITNID